MASEKGMGLTVDEVGWIAKHIQHSMIQRDRGQQMLAHFVNVVGTFRGRQLNRNSLDSSNHFGLLGLSLIHQTTVTSSWLQSSPQLGRSLDDRAGFTPTTTQLCLQVVIEQLGGLEYGDCT